MPGLPRARVRSPRRGGCSTRHERLLTEQVEADPEDLESQFRLIRVELRLARLERDDLQFARAAELFSRALEWRQRLNQKARFGGVSMPKNQEIELLKTEIAVCELAPRAMADLGFARSQPPPRPVCYS